MTPRVWQTPLLWSVFGIVIAALFLPQTLWPQRIGWGVVYALLAGFSFVFVHLLGHIISGRAVGGVMASAVLDGIRVTNIYNDTPEDSIPSRVHLGRALGGPLANGVISVLGFAGWGLSDAHALLFLAIFNLLAGLSVLFPSPGVDGEVIWRELRRPRGS